MLNKNSWPQMMKHWKNHEQGFDPDKALDHVCITGSPQWLNEYHDKIQKIVFRMLLPKQFHSALDIGCGAGRWVQVLGPETHYVDGIDIQEKLITENRKRLSKAKYFCCEIQNFSPGQKYDLISSVTVIQHNPYEEQKKIVHKLRSWLNERGHALILENTSFHSKTVFPNSYAAWKELFETNGFVLVRAIKYDYSFFSRFGWKLRFWLFKRIGVFIDSYLEPLFIRLQLPFMYRHAGFIFRRESLEKHCDERNGN